MLHAHGFVDRSRVDTLHSCFDILIAQIIRSTAYLGIGVFQADIGNGLFAIVHPRDPLVAHGHNLTGELFIDPCLALIGNRSEQVAVTWIEIGFVLFRDFDEGFHVIGIRIRCIQDDRLRNNGMVCLCDTSILDLRVSVPLYLGVFSFHST